MYSVCIVNILSFCIFDVDKILCIVKVVVNGVVVGGFVVVVVLFVLFVVGFLVGGIVVGFLVVKLMFVLVIVSGGSECLWFDCGCIIGRSCWDISWYKYWDWCWNRESRGVCSF